MGAVVDWKTDASIHYKGFETHKLERILAVNLVFIPCSKAISCLNAFSLGLRVRWLGKSQMSEERKINKITEDLIQDGILCTTF